MPGNNNNTVEPQSTTDDKASNLSNNNTIESPVSETAKTEAAAPAVTSSTLSDDSQLNKHNSQINISKDNINQNTNQNRNSIAKNNNDNNNTEEILYDIPVGE